MTDREKALEALNRLYQSHSENSFAPFPTRSDLDAISLELHKPSFDDAVKVVEKRFEQHQELRKHYLDIKLNGMFSDECLISAEYVNLINDITALRKRGKGK